jgi:putative ABC transport system permease protein
MALGSTKAAVLVLVLREGLILTVTGLLVGVIATAVFTRRLESQLYEVRANDPLVLALAAVTLVVIVAAASVVPARRASHIDPVAALNK